ncbi:MAG: DnaJ domain-containing protein, partial [Chryseolinea sp.]
MTNYYQILGIGRHADSTQIRTAYKRLAMAYHPDLNHNPEAEELFKVVNEAYRTLSDSLKKARYDEQMFPQHHPRVEAERLRRQGVVYTHRTKKDYYKIDKQYFRHQALSILAFIVLAGCCFALMNGIQYFVEQRQLRSYHENSFELKQAGSLFGAGKFDDAFTRVRALTLKAPLEVRVHYTFDSLMITLRKKANLKFEEKDYATSMAYYMVIKKHENPVDPETMRKISIGQYYLGNYRESLEAMNFLYETYPDNAELVYSMAVLNLEKLKNPSEALKYFNISKSILMRKLSGQASLMAVSETAPTAELLSDVLIGSAEANIS